MRVYRGSVVGIVVAIGLIWSFAVLLKLLPVFDSSSVPVMRAAK
jgi:hypothetical protein